jgi:hypothetical protein
MPSPILKNAIESLEHALDHWAGSTDRDRKFAIMLMDQAVELILKERVLSLGKSIYHRDKKSTISGAEALEILANDGHAVPETPQLELLHDERNQIQHKSASPDPETTTYYMEAGLNFALRFLEQDLQVDPRTVFSASVLDVFEDRDPVSKADSMIDAAFSSVTTDASNSVLASAIAAELLLRSRFVKEFPEIATVPLETASTRLRERGLITDAVSSVLRQLAQVRNAVRHGAREASPDDAARFAEAVRELRSRLLTG